MTDVEMNGDGDSAHIAAALSTLGDLEKDFAEVELKYRKAAHAHRDLDVLIVLCSTPEGT